MLCYTFVELVWGCIGRSDVAQPCAAPPGRHGRWRGCYHAPIAQPVPSIRAVGRREHTGAFCAAGDLTGGELCGLPAGERVVNAGEARIDLVPRTSVRG